MLNIHLFGNFALERGGRHMKLAAPPRAASLLAYLLLRPTPQPREQVAALLWPELSNEAGRANLRRYLSHLSHALPPAATDRPWLMISRTTVQWNPDSEYWLDVAAFEQACSQDDPIVTELYRGELLTDVFDDWLLYERERLRNLYLATLERLARQALGQHRYSEASNYTRLMLDADPLHEDYIRLLISIRYAAGDRAGALADYDRFRRELQSELDTEPMPETVALYEAIVRNATLPQTAATSQPLASPSVSHERRPFILPFAGREREMAQLTQAWARAQQGSGGIALISGEAGIGKTRLTAEMSAFVLAQGGRALRGAAAEGDTSPYQALVLALHSALPLLAAIDTDSAELSALLPLLPELRQRRPELTPLPRLEPQQERTRLYSTLVACLAALGQPRPLLLILEDLHWAGAATIDFLRYLTPRLAAHSLLLLATYREGEAERRHPLHELRRLVMQPAGGLHLPLNPLDASAFAAIVAQVEGLAGDDLAAQLYAQGEGNPLFLSELVADRLEGGTASSAPSGVHALINERFARLQPNTRLLAEVAAVVGASFDAELVREVAGWNTGQALTALDELLDRNLVHDEGRRGGYDYAFSHNLIQQTIYSGIDSGVRTRRHRRTARVLEELNPERRDELAAALARHFDLGEDPAAAVPYYLKAARYALAVYADEEALAAADRVLELSDDPHLRFDALALREGIYHRSGDRAAQQADLDLMTEIAEELGDDELTCEVLHRRIKLHNALGEAELAMRWVEQLTRQAASLGLPWQALALSLRATEEINAELYEPALAHATSALGLYEQSGDRAGQIACYCLLARVSTNQGHFAEASQRLMQAQALADSNNGAEILPILRHAVAAADQHDPNQALVLANQMLTVSRAIHDRGSEADACTVLARIQGERQEIAAALASFTQAQTIYTAIGHPKGQAAVLGRSGVLHASLGNYAQGKSLLEQGEAIYKAINNARGQILCLYQIATIANDVADYATAKAAASQGLTISAAQDNLYYNSYLLVELGIAELGLNEAAARTHLQASVALSRAPSDDPDNLVKALCWLAVACLRDGDLSAAYQYSDEALTICQTQAEQIIVQHPDYWVRSCVVRARGDETTAQQYLTLAYQRLKQHQRQLEQRLGRYADESWRNYYNSIPANRATIAAYERGEWPAYASPLPSSLRVTQFTRTDAIYPYSSRHI
jgi:DNA-binding SARP family transcriptional activator/predicted ATPase